jgi:hypothetical protein
MNFRPWNKSARPSHFSPLVLVILGLLRAAAPAQVLFHEDFNDSSAGWTLETTWQIGPAIGGCGDSSWDADGRLGGGIAGNGIGACTTPTYPTMHYLVSPAIDASGSDQLRFEYDRYQPWFNVWDAAMHIDVFDGTTWVNIVNMIGGWQGAHYWEHAAYDISPFANPALRIRFGYAAGTYSAPGFSIDNVRISQGEVFHDRFRDNAAGWTLGPQWAIGDAAASVGCATDVGFYDDPAHDADGTPGGGLAGAMIGGCTGGPAHASYYLESPPIDTSSAQILHLEFDRWLNSDCVPYQNSTVEVFDGTSWVTIFDTPWPQAVADNSWVHKTYVVTPYKNAAFRVRFGYDNTPASYNVGGWNVDNVSIYDPSGCNLALWAYNGPGSIRVKARCYSNTVPAGTTLFNCITLNAGNFPNGLFFGIDPSLQTEVLPQLLSGAPPFVGVSGPSGAFSWELPQGVPAGITVYGVTLALSPGGYILGTSPPTTFTTL